MANEKVKQFLENKEQILKKLKASSDHIKREAFKIEGKELEKQLITFLNKQTDQNWKRVIFKTPYETSSSCGYQGNDTCYNSVKIAGISPVKEGYIQAIGVSQAVKNGQLILLDAHIHSPYLEDSDLLNNTSKRVVSYDDLEEGQISFTKMYEFLSFKNFSKSTYKKVLPFLHQKLKVMVIEKYLNYIKKQVENDQDRVRRIKETINQKEQKLLEARRDAQKHETEVNEKAQIVRNTSKRLIKVVEDFETEQEQEM